MFHKFFPVTVCFMHIFYLSGADNPTVDFLSENKEIAAQEIKIIDWALLYAAKKETMSSVAEKIEHDRYRYLDDDGLDHDCCSSLVEMDSPLHIKENLNNQRNHSDYTFLRKQFSKDELTKKLPQYLTHDEKTNVTKMETRSVFMAIEPTYFYLGGLKQESAHTYNANPSIFVQVLIEKGKSDQQHKINKNYLLERLRAVCTEEKQCQ